MSKLIRMVERVRKRKKRDIKLPDADFLPKVPKEHLEGVHTKFTEDHPRMAFYLTLLGCTSMQMSQVLGVDPNTITYWKNKYPEFHEAIEQGKERADALVAHSLYRSAIGYSHPMQVVLTNRIRKYGEDGRVREEWTEPLVVDIEKNYPPNTKAAIKWLQARKPEIWGNKLEVKGRITMHHQIDMSKFSDEELKLLSKLGESKEIEDVNYEEE